MTEDIRFAEDMDDPQEDDLITYDHRRVWQYGKVVLEIGEDEDFDDAVRAFMERERFWPNVWWVSDHGNAHLVTLKDDPKAPED